VVLGCQLHFAIAIGAALVYHALGVKVPAMARRPWLAGPTFGLGVFTVMHYVVVPLSAAPRQPPHGPVWFFNMLFSHTLFVGLPIALIARPSLKGR
jgi:hypothetical protein